MTNERLLTDVGELEQDLVLGEKNSKDLVAFLSGGGWPEVCFALVLVGALLK